jgi:hypothetical protein
VKKILIGFFIIFIFLVMSFSLVFINIFNQSYDQRTFKQCVEMEQKGYIEPGSCDCADRLFPDFNRSYDWMDACKIEQSMNRSK